MRSQPSLRRSRAVQTVGFVSCLALSMILTGTSRGQSPASDGSSLARYVPRDNLGLYIEFDGIDGHADAWKKTAAYKILNNTTVGAMLEDVAVQLIDRLPGPTGEPGKRGVELVAMFKHAARAGFLIAEVGNPADPTKPSAILVIRDAFKDKDIRAIMAKTLQGMAAPGSKPQAAVRAGHKVITGTTTKGLPFAWWVDDARKQDIVQVFGPDAPEACLETLDGKRPSAIDHPQRVDLFKPEGSFFPNGGAFLAPGYLGRFAVLKPLGLAEFTRLDYRWGFQDDALVSVARLATPGPRKGLPGLLDGSTIDKGKLPPIPETVGGFTVTSFDTIATLDKMAELVKGLRPDGKASMDQFFEKFQARTKLQLKEDFLTHVGPKVAWYVLPSKPGAKAPSSPANPLAAMLGGSGADILPRLAVVFEIDDATSFGKALDEAMLVVNRELKTMGRPAGEAPSKGARGRNQGPPPPEFRVIPGKSKLFALYIPPETPSPLPPSFRPAILVGPKHAVVAVSLEAARAALESKGSWTPSNELGVAYQALPSKLKFLSVSDPRETLPGLLAALPAKIQVLANTAMMVGSPPPPAPPGASPPNGGNGDPNNQGNRRRNGPGPGGPNGPGGPAAPAAGSAPGAPAPLVLQVDAAKLPSSDAIKALLFPSLLSVESNGDEIRISSRIAFPTVGDPSQAVVALSLVLPAIQAIRAGRPVPGMAPPPGAPPAGAPPGGSPAPGSNGRTRPGGPPNASGGGNATTRPD